MRCVTVTVTDISGLEVARVRPLIALLQCPVAFHQCLEEQEDGQDRGRAVPPGAGAGGGGQLLICLPGLVLSVLWREVPGAELSAGTPPSPPDWSPHPGPGSHTQVRGYQEVRAYRLSSARALTCLGGGVSCVGRH